MYIQPVICLTFPNDQLKL